MEYQIVVARYNEDISYLSIFKNIIIIYNKGIDNLPFNFTSIKLPNIGRESHTYLYHIIKNYDNLANKTLFIHGNIKDHNTLPLIDYFNKENHFIGNKTFVDINLIKNYIYHSGKYLKDLNEGKMIKSLYKPIDWIKMIGIDISNEITNFEMVWGANFSVSKELIHKKPKIFYENLIKYVEYHANPEEGHYFERSWYLIYSSLDFKIKKKILYYYTDNINVNLIKKCTDILKKSSDIINIHLWTTKLNDTYLNDVYLIDINKSTKSTKSNKSNKLNNRTILNLKYTNSYDYIKIYPPIYDNTFDILFKMKNIHFSNDKNIYLLLVFENNIFYELEINQHNIVLYDYILKDSNNYLTQNITDNKNIISKYIITNNEKILINNINLLKLIEINIKIKYINNKIEIYYNNNNIINFNTNNIFIDVKVRTDNNNDLFILYNNENISLMNSITNSIPRYFYKDNYDDYYTQELIEYYFDNFN